MALILLISLLIDSGHAWPWHVDAVGTPAPDLQAAFEVLPPNGEAGWLGADSDVSVAIRGGSSGRRSLWIFADSFVARYNSTSKSRLLPWHMPRNSMAVSECTKTGCDGPPQFSIRKDASGIAPAMFGGSGEHGEVIWPVAAIASRDGGRVLIIAQRIVGAITLNGVAAIVMDVGESNDPSQWNYTMSNVSGPELAWFSGVTYAHPDDENDDMVYVFGHESKNPQALLTTAGRLAPSDDTVLSRARLSRLLQHDWSGLEFWSQGSMWTPSSDQLLDLGVPSWEATWHWSAGLSRWYTFNLNNTETGGAAVNMWTSANITGPWVKTASILRLPAPFNGTAVPAQTHPGWICYAAKAHPELIATTFVAAGTDELVFSYVCNSWGGPVGGEELIKKELFQTGGMTMRLRGYWPRFVKVSAKLTTDSNIVV